MKILNLVNQDKSDIKFKISKFPDGQQNCTIQAYKFNDIWIGSQKHHFKEFTVQIKSRLNNWLDLELIVAAVASLRNLHIQHIELFVPYFLGARSDRKFEEGGNHYLKNVICPIINSLKLNKITVLDPHSHVLEALITNFAKFDNKQLVEFALADLYCPAMKNHPLFAAGLESEDRFGNFILISPDAGASHKIYKLAEKINYKGKIYTANKERDTEGNLSNQAIPNYHNDRFEHMDKDVIIIDDICDGGRTFLNLGKIIKAERHQKCKGKTYLIITHGIFSAGFKELNKYFDGIYCTNSYSTIGDYAGNDMEKTNVKQLNIF